MADATEIPFDVGHPCMMPSGCTRMAHSDWALCGSCHRLLPFPYREELARTYARGMTAETASKGLRMALYNAHAWMVRAFGAQDKDDLDPATKWERLKSWVKQKDEARRAGRTARAPANPVPNCPSLECPCDQCWTSRGAPTE